jgi:sulfur carrier protein ThiS
MDIQINGEHRQIEAPLKLEALIEGGGRVAVEVNGDIVPRSRWSAVILRDGDRVEIVRAIGGG